MSPPQVWFTSDTPEQEIALAHAFLSICSDMQANPEYGAPTK